MPPTLPLRWESTGDQWWYASPIDWAAANGHYDLVCELLRLDGNHLIKLTSLRRIQRLEVVWDDEEQFHDVAKNRSLIARKLLHEGANNSLIGSGYGGWLLYSAASAGDLEFVRELLQKDPLLVFGEGEYGVTEILYAAARSKNTEVFTTIYDFAISPRFMSGNGRELEEHDAGIPSGYKQEMKNRAVHALARGGNLKILKELLGDCSDEDVLAYKDVHGSTILHAAAARGQVEVVKDLISSYRIINTPDKKGNIALHIAAYRGQLSVVDVLIQACPSCIHSKNNAGETFLHMAVLGFTTPTFRRFDRQVILMKQLICSKTFNIEETINATDNEGRTALHLAIIGNIHSDLVELLMSVYSINVNIRDNRGMTPLRLLKQRPHSALSELLTRQLISAGANLSSEDYSARRTIASRMGSIGGGSPGTSFKIVDSEILLQMGMDNTSSTVYDTPVSSVNSAELSQPDTSSNCNIESKRPKKKNKGIRRFLLWIKMRKTRDKDLTLTRNLNEIPVPLRQRYSKPSSFPNNKRTLAARSNLSSPIVKKKLASGLVDGVMQAMPHLNERSGSNLKSSLNSSDNKLAGMSSLNQMFDDGAWSFSSEEQGVVNSKRSVNQCFCFGMHVQSNADQKQRDVYDRYVLSTA